jgi:dTDP-4-dehydrorhamnose reductase
MGQATQEALSAFPDLFDLSCFGRDLDICDHENMARVLTEFGPKIVINAAAFTAVDACEVQPERAFATNGAAVANLARLCSALGATLIHLSTDYVFGNSSPAPLSETDVVAPLNVYGVSKAQGEVAIRANCEHHVIVRTSWIYGRRAGNFFATMMALGATHEIVNVVQDEASCPTLASDLAECLSTICRRIASGTALYGTFHIAGALGLSRFAFAQAIMDAREAAGLSFARVLPVSQAEFGAQAQRPIDSRMDCTAFQNAYKRVPLGLEACLPGLVASMTA